MVLLFANVDDFEQEVSDKHPVLLPILFNIINDPTGVIYTEALSTLDVLVENLGEDVVPYTQELMNTLVHLWNHNERKIQIFKKKFVIH